MIDRKRLILFVSIGAVLVLAVVGLIIALVVMNSKNGAAEVAPSPTPTVEETPVITFTPEQVQVVRNTAKIATTWSGATDPELMRTRYEQAGMSKDLAQGYSPIWAQAFESGVTAEVNASKIAEPVVLDYKPGKAPNTGLFVVGVEITYEGYSHKDGQTRPIGPGTATWTFALDERYNTITGVEQPQLSEIKGL